MVTSEAVSRRRSLHTMVKPITLILLLAGLPLRGAFADAANQAAILNHAPAAIVEVYVSAADDTSWGDDRLGQEPVAPGAAWHVPGLPAGTCSVDVRVVYADGRAEEKHGLNICRTHDVAFDASAAAAPLARPLHRVTIENRGSRAVDAAFLSAPTSDDWGDDRLKKPLEPGAAVIVDQPGSCIADLRVVYANRGAEERRRIDICRNQMVSLKPGWTTSDDLAPPDDATAGVKPDHRT